MIDSNSVEEILLTDEDFPDYFEDFAHPNDYVMTNQPITPEHICHSRLGQHHRLLFRISVSCGGKYFSVSFVCDTGAPRFLYLCPKMFALMENLGAIKVDEDTGLRWVMIENKKVPLDETPECHRPANIIGLRLLYRLGLYLEENTFGFSRGPNCFEIQK